MLAAKSTPNLKVLSAFCRDMNESTLLLPAAGVHIAVR